MAMVQKMWSVGGAALELQRSERFLGRVLRGVEPDGRVKGGHPGWLMSNIVAAIARYESQPIHLGLSARRARGGTISGNGAAAPSDPALGEIERVARAVSEGMDRLRRADPSERLATLRTFGKQVGRLDRLMQRANAREGADAVTTLTPFTDGTMAALVTEITALLNAADATVVDQP
jgi:hypothetical protein